MEERSPEDGGRQAAGEPNEILTLDGKGASTSELAQARRTIEFLEGLLPSLSDDADAAQALHDIGQLRLLPLDDPAGALEAMRVAFRRRPALHIARAYRKAALRVGSVEDQLLALEGEARAAKSPTYRAALETERGVLLERALGNLPAAEQAFATAVELQPGDLAARLALLRLALGDGDKERAIEHCRGVAEATSDVRIKADYLAWAARLYELVGQGEAALAAAVQAQVHAPDSPAVRFVLERLLAAHGRPRERIALLEAAIAGGALPSIEGWWEIAIAARYHVGDLDSAERALARMVDKTEGVTRAVVLGELADLWVRKGDWQRVVDAELAYMPRADEPSGCAMAWTRIGQLREERLDDLPGAIDAYAKAIEADASHLPALEAAGRAFAKKGATEQLIWMHKMEADHAASATARSAALRRAGELLLTDAARADEGIALLESALVATPDHAGIFVSLERALRGKGAWSRLRELYQRELDRVAEPRRRGWLLLQIGELSADRLGDARGAIAALRGAAETPGGVPHHALTRLAQLLEDEGKLDELEAVLAQLTALTDDPAQRTSLCERAALLQEQRGDIDGALCTYCAALPAAPLSHSIHASAGRAFARAERWPELLALYERAAVEGNDVERANYGYKAGLLLARRLLRVEDGLARLEQVRAAAPGHLPTLLALATLYQEAQRWSDLRPVLAELPTTPARLVRRAALAEVTGHPDEALSLWQAALDAGVTIAARPRARLLAQLGRWSALAASYEATQPNGTGVTSVIHARYRAAEIYAERLSEPARAAELLTAALAADAESVPLMLALLRVVDKAAPTRRTALQALVAGVRDPALRVALLGQLASLMSEREALPTRINQMAAAPRDPVVLVHIERALEERHNREALAALLRDMRRDTKADPALTAATAARLGALCEELGSLREAADVCEAAVASAEPSFVARLALTRLYAALGDETRLAQALRALADALPPGAERATTLRRLALHHRRRDDVAQAAAALEDALAAHPLDYDALRELAALPIDAERLIDPLQRAFAAEPPGAQRLAVGLVLAARLLRADRLGPAREVLDRVIADHAGALGAWLLSAELETRAEAWSHAVAALGHVADHAEAPPEVKIEALRRMATLQLDRQEDLAAARTTADRLGQLAPDDLEGAQVQLRIAERAEDHAQTVDLLGRLIAHPRLDDQHRADLQLRLATVQEVKLDDVAAAIQTLGEVKLGARRRDAVDRLLDLGGRTGRWDLAASALEATLDHGGEMDAGWELAIRSRLANLLEGPLRRPESAIRQYERIVAIDHRHVPALERLAELSAATAPDRAIEYHRALVASQPTRLSSYRALRELFARVGDEDGAFLTDALLEGVGCADEEESYFYRQRRARLSGQLEGVLTHDERALLAPEAMTPPFALLHLLAPSLATVFPPDFAAYGVDSGEASPGVAAAANRMARLFSVDTFRLATVPNRVGPCVEPGTPAVLLLPRNLDDATPREQSCVLGGLLARITFDGLLGDPRRLSPASPVLLEHVLWAACELGVADAQAPQRGRPVYEDIKRRLDGALSAATRTELALAAARVLAEEIFSGEAILGAMESAALRASLFAAQDPAIAITVARGTAAAGGRGLEALPAGLLAALPFVVSREHLALRRRLRIGVAG